MKKLLFISILLIASMGLKAQESHFGAKLGLGFTSLNTPNSSNSNAKSKLGVNVGAVAEFMLSDQFAIAPELLYSTLGQSYKWQYEGDNWEDNYASSYLQIPVMARYYVNDNLYLNGGIQLGLLLSATDTEILNGHSHSENVKSQLESTDFGFGIGGGYKLENGLFFDARYIAGLSNINIDKDWPIKNNAIMFSAGYYFN